MRSTHLFNADWLFVPDDVPADTPDDAFESVTLPHSTALVPHHNFGVSDYAFVSTYRKRFVLPEPRNGRRVWLDFDGAMIAATVTINGHTFDEYKGGYTPFSFDITEYLNASGQNVLTVRLDSSERPDIPPFGFVVDYLAFGGIYRDVWLRYVEPCHVEQVFVRPQHVLSETPRLDIDVKLANQGESPRNVTVLAKAHRTVPDVWEGASDSAAPTVAAGEELTTLVSFERVESVVLWTLDQPVLYTVEVGLFDDGELLDSVIVRFGWREAEFRTDGGFYLNGARVDLIGLNRHQTYPFIGAAAPARLQQMDADIIKHELGCNIVRTSHYPQSPYFLDRCDEIGLLVFEEIPGWQHIGDAAWKALSLRDVRAMIERDRHHPSIILWGVRINESLDDHDFYTQTNALAHQLDPTRQTGGVRYFMESEFLEDVFTFNDFSNDVLEPIHTPHLVTEFNGHMFPTKSWDQEERAVEHALRHARIQDKQLGMPRVAGAIGWCAFDYNTHVDFGSGDRICYHGVMDTFRLPKHAAYAYASQVDPAERVVLYPATVFAQGERSVGGFNPLIVFSNCDAIKVHVEDDYIGRFEPDRATYPHLPHAPFTVTGFSTMWGGAQRSDLRIVGYLNGSAVIEHRIAGDGLPAALELRADSETLHADGADMTRLVFRIVDRYGNRLPYSQAVIGFEVDGPADLIGEQPFPLMGGQAALFVKARHAPGTVTIRATTPRLPPASVTITLVGV